MSVCAPKRDVADLVDGIRFEDPHRRLEDDSAEVREWEAALDDEARMFVRALPHFRAVNDAVARHMSACLGAAPRRAGDFWFRLEADVDGDNQALVVMDGPGEPGREIVRADDLAVGAKPGIDWFAPSPDGAWLAVGVSTSGSEQSVLRFVDVGAARVVSPCLPHVSGGAVAWLPSSRALYCLAGWASDAWSLRKQLVLVEPGGDPSRTELPPRDPARRHSLQISPDGRFVGLLGYPAAPRLTHLFDTETERWSEVAPVAHDATLCGVFKADRYFAVTTAGADRGRVVSAPIEAMNDRESWNETVPESQDVLRAVTSAGDLLLLCYAAGGVSRLRLVSSRGEVIESVTLPEDGLVTTSAQVPAQYGVAPVQVDKDGLTFAFSSVRRSPVLMRFDLSSGETRALSQPKISLDGLQAMLKSCASSDGAEVAYELIQVTGSSGPRPTLILAYGGWNAMSASKGYPGALAAFVEAGGNLVFAHGRGDGTYGADQWQGGRRRHKQQSFDDVYAIGADLLARNVARADQLGVCGFSNGGLLVGAAIVQQPHMFRVAVAVVPLLDMCRFLRDRFGEHVTWEYGDPRDPADASVLRSYSPYHNVDSGVRYPATLLVCGGADLRTPSWHGRKMAAALRCAAGDGTTVLLRVHQDHGHVTTSDLAPPTIVAEWLTFAMHELGLGAPKPAHAARLSRQPTIS